MFACVYTPPWATHAIDSDSSAANNFSDSDGFETAEEFTDDEESNAC